MHTETILIGLIEEYKNGEIDRKEAIAKMLHVCLTAAHQRIEEFETSEEHANGIPVSDLFESEILLPLALTFE
jgi:hypothetical protein